MSQCYSGLLNDKEFCFSLIGLNSIFSTLPQSEYTSRAVRIPRIQWVCLACSEDTSREVYSGLCLFLSIVYSVFQRCPTRDEISFPVGQSNWKKKTKFSKISKYIDFTKLKKNSYKISKFSKQNSKLWNLTFLF
jgi:hypothetical protein